MKKVSVIGAGNVGSTAAMAIAGSGLADVCLVDIVEGIPQGKALDIQHSTPLSGSSARVTGSNDFSDIRDSDIVVVTAGVPRKPGMSREDLVEVNSGIIRKVCSDIRKHAHGSIAIVITNPLDMMAMLAYRELGFPRERVMGMAGVLDSARLRCLLSLETGRPPSEIEAMVMGSHGDTMVPCLERTKVGGKPAEDSVSAERLGEIVKRTRDSGTEVISHLKTCSAFYAPGASIARMVEAILRDSGEIMPVSAYLDGEYGQRGLFIGVPARLGREGIKEVVELELSEDTRKAFARSAGIIKENLRKCSLL